MLANLFAVRSIRTLVTNNKKSTKMRKKQLISILSLAERMLKSGSKLPLNFSASVEKFRQELQLLS